MLRMSEENSIFIGNKPFMNYVTGVVMQFTLKKVSKVYIKARGKYITRAVDVSEVVRKRFLDNSVEVDNVIIGSNNFTTDDGKQLRISTIEISLVKK